MAREILFRAKRLDNGEWIEGFLLKVTVLEKPFSFIFKDAFVYDGRDVKAACRAVVDDDTVGQYTGRVDKHGKRVFEGDIIRLCDGIPGFDVGVVLWDNNDQAYRIVQNPAENVALDDFGNYGQPEYYEVIGNVYDNPELLGSERRGNSHGA